ncbi:MAG: hypothetical protein M1438_11025 [Deltaproteobacteria bacterium]|nr:hypothetical protein [Deltaproteobacteria bacterium]
MPTEELVPDSTGKRHFDIWQENVNKIGHINFPFLDPVYSPNSHVPCKGFVEWIAESWLDSDIESISRLFCELMKPDPILSITLRIQLQEKHYGSNDNNKERCAKLPEIIKKINIGNIINGLNGKQIATLISAYMLQSNLGCSDESIIVNLGRFLMA